MVDKLSYTVYKRTRSARDARRSGGHRTLTHTWLWAVLIAWVVSFVTLVSSPAIVRILKQRGARAVERLMGMLLVMLSVQMFLNGLREYLAGR